MKLRRYKADNASMSDDAYGDWVEFCDAQKLQARIDELEFKLSRMTIWLEENQPEVFRHGIWDAIAGETLRFDKARMGG